MILKKMSFNHVKKKEYVTKNKKIKFIERKSAFNNQKSSSDYNLITIKIHSNNELPSVMHSRNHNHIPKNKSYNNYTLNENVNTIISNLKFENKNNNRNNPPNQSTDFNSSLYNNSISSKVLKSNNNKTSFSFSSKAKRRQNYNISIRKTIKLNKNLLENTDFSRLLKNQESLQIKNEHKRAAKSSVQMPYILKKNKSEKNYKYVGLYTTGNTNKENNLLKEINNLMTINQKIKLGKRKNRSFSFNNKKKSANENVNSFNNANRENADNSQKKVNIKIQFSFARKRDEFIEKNRLLMKENYFKNLLNERVSNIENQNLSNKKEIKYLKNRIYILNDFIIHFKINNIINHNLRLLDHVIESNTTNEINLLKIIKKYNKDIERLTSNINNHNRQRNEIFFWYKFLCKIKGEKPIEINDENFKKIVNCLIFNDLSKGFNQMATNIITLENKYKNNYDEIHLLNQEKEIIKNHNRLMNQKDADEIKNKERELYNLKDVNKNLNNIKNNTKKKKVIDFLDLEKYANVQYNYRYNYYFKKETNKISILIQKIGYLFENYVHYLKSNFYFKNLNVSEKKQINKLEKDLLKCRKNTNKKILYFKSHVFDIFFVIERFVNFLIYYINQQKQIMRKEEFRIIINKAKFLKNFERKVIILYDKQKEETEDIIRKGNKLYFLPKRKVYIPFLAIKNEAMKNNLNKKNSSFSHENKTKYHLTVNENQNKVINKTKSHSYYEEEDDDDLDKYNELFF